MFIVSVAGVVFNLVVFLVLGVHAHHGGCDHSHDHGDASHGHSHGHDGHSHSDGPSGHSHGGSGHSHDASGGHSHGHSNGKEHANINMRGALLHVVGDLLQSFGVAMAGLLIWLHPDDTR